MSLLYTQLLLYRSYHFHILFQTHLSIPIRIKPLHNLVTIIHTRRHLFQLRKQFTLQPRKHTHIQFPAISAAVHALKQPSGIILKVATITPFAINLSNHIDILNKVKLPISVSIILFHLIIAIQQIRRRFS